MKSKTVAAPALDLLRCHRSLARMGWSSWFRKQKGGPTALCRGPPPHVGVLFTLWGGGMQWVGLRLLPSAAKAGTLPGLCGTTEVVPFPVGCFRRGMKRAGSGLYRPQRLKPDHQPAWCGATWSRTLPVSLIAVWGRTLLVRELGTV